MRSRKLGELRWVATVSRPDPCARLAKLASRINPLRWSDAYRIRNLARAVKARQMAAALKYASSSHPRGDLGFAGKERDDM